MLGFIDNTRHDRYIAILLGNCHISLLQVDDDLVGRQLERNVMVVWKRKTRQ